MNNMITHMRELLLAGHSVSYGDLEIHNLSKPDRVLVQVFKKNHSVKNKKGEFLREEYNLIHRDYTDAIKDYIRLKEQYFGT